MTLTKIKNILLQKAVLGRIMTPIQSGFIIFSFVVGVFFTLHVFSEAENDIFDNGHTVYI